MKEAPSHRMRVTASTICHHLNSPERHYFHHKRPFLNFHYGGCCYNHSTSTCPSSNRGSASRISTRSKSESGSLSYNSPRATASDQCPSRWPVSLRKRSGREWTSYSLSQAASRDNKRTSGGVRRSKHEYLVTTTALLCVMSLVLCRQLCDASWDQWWTYDGISGKISNEAVISVATQFGLQGCLSQC